MGRRKVVTSVTLDPNVCNQGRDAGFNFSQILEQGIIARLEPSKYLEILESELIYKEKEVIRIKEEMAALKVVENKESNRIFDELVRQVRPVWEEHGYIPEMVLERYSLRLRKTIPELEEEILCQLAK